MSIDLFACDVCGCAISGHQFGILPQFQKHFLGLRYGTRTFQTMHPPVFSTDILTSSREHFQNIDIWGRIVLTERIQLFGFIPYSSIVKKEDGQVFKQNGLGDISLLALYSIINQHQSKSLALRQNLQIGGGIKLPTGSYDVMARDGTYVPGVQLGSGSIDILANLSYIIRYQNFGLSVESSFRHNTTNDLDFQFGDRFTNAARFFYKINVKDIAILPNLGVHVETALKDKHENLILDLSGGHGVYGQMGIDIFTSSITIGFQFQPVIYENIGNGNITSSSRFSIQSMYIF